MIEKKLESLGNKNYNIYNDIANRLGLVLLKKGIIDSKTFIQAILKKKNEYSNGNGRLKKNLAQVLVQDFNLDHDTVYREVANLYAFDIVEFDFENGGQEILGSIKQFVSNCSDDLKKQMLLYRVVPLGYDEKVKEKIKLAAVDPTIKEIPKVAFDLNAKSFEVVYIPPDQFKTLIELLLPPENKYLKNIKEGDYDFQDITEDENIDEGLLEVEINKSALVSLFEGALIEGVRKGASDIHIIPLDNMETVISMRIDGRLNLWHKQENTHPEAVIAVVKDRSRGLDRFERETGQDGYIQREIDGHVIRFRVSILPIAGSEVKNKFESVVIRILDDRKVITDLDELGLIGYSRESFEKAISKPQGMVILTGPTGCGKSTTIIAALNHVMDPSLNVLTVEDPIEYVIKGARQIKLNHKLDFDKAIRSILRHDPDVVMVGEIRDKQSADIAIKLANTGHLTFTTLHTNNATSVVSRLYKMGIEPFLLAYSINVIVAQRLVRKLCKCKKKISNMDPSFFKGFKLDPVEWSKYDIYEPNGCDKCGYTGFKGRIAIHETLFFTKEISQLIFDAGDKINEERLRKAAKKDGMLSLRESGFERVKEGFTSFEEVISNTSDD